MNMEYILHNTPKKEKGRPQADPSGGEKTLY